MDSSGISSSLVISQLSFKFMSSILSAAIKFCLMAVAGGRLFYFLAISIWIVCTLSREVYFWIILGASNFWLPLTTVLSFWFVFSIAAENWSPHMLKLWSFSNSKLLSSFLSSMTSFFFISNVRDCVGMFCWLCLCGTMGMFRHYCFSSDSSFSGLSSFYYTSGDLGRAYSCYCGCDKNILTDASISMLKDTPVPGASTLSLAVVIPHITSVVVLNNGCKTIRGLSFAVFAACYCTVSSIV